METKNSKSETLIALENSIEHWKDNLKKAILRENILTGIDDCALCALFWYNKCTGCPIASETGKSGCRGTPYERVIYQQDLLAKHLSYYYDAETIDSDYNDLISAIKDEIKFLESLKEKENPKMKTFFDVSLDTILQQKQTKTEKTKNREEIFDVQIAGKTVEFTPRKDLVEFAIHNSFNRKHLQVWKISSNGQKVLVSHLF